MARFETFAVVSTDRRRLRWLRWLIGVLLVLILLFFAGGGWYFSGQIRSDALLIKDWEVEFEHEVTGASAESITFVLPSDPEDDLLSGEVLGVRWETGYGISGEVISRTETQIAKAFDPITGGLPEPGTMVALEGCATPPDPADAGLAYTEVVYSAEATDFDAWLTEGDRSTWAILVHGRGSNRKEAVRMLPAFVERDIPALVIQYRNDPGALATEDRLATFGVTEWEDLEGAVAYALDRGADDVILVGYSMGGALVMSFLYQSDLAGSVRAVVLDAPALELGAMVDFRAGDTSLPLLPIDVPIALTATAKWIAGLRFGVNWGEIDYLDERVESLEAPLLVLHGAEDGSVPIALSRELAVLRSDIVQLEEFPDARHVRSWNVDPERYMAVVGGFLDHVAP